ncbi:hypothetical protein LC605_17670 [Nostoc sp. CHAB 5836]|uniref:hypothetical protein n=1 Tax=Nostoc sp. CHAB 5836 TaxID=2780404 RepID=UPI001E5CC992|nr:hypothetical protein [Nostoc sp. CHAB 5836]MCC5616871.1 hypothetical protein [Nostoc sp. CHAB 5836]
MKTKHFIASTLSLFTTTALCFPLVQSTVAQAQTTSTAVVGTTKIAAGSTTPGATSWQPYPATENGIYVDVDTSEANFTSTPKYVTSIGGDDTHWQTTGGSAIYFPTPKGFRIYVRFSPDSILNPAIANQKKFHINWIGIGQ